MALCTEPKSSADRGRLLVTRDPCRSVKFRKSVNPRRDFFVRTSIPTPTIGRKVCLLTFKDGRYQVVLGRTTEPTGQRQGSNIRSLLPPFVGMRLAGLGDFASIWLPFFERVNSGLRRHENQTQVQVTTHLAQRRASLADRESAERICTRAKCGLYESAPQNFVCRVCAWDG